MCGLVGVFGDMYKNHTTYFKQALISDYFRGKHSTGLTVVRNDSPSSYKKAIDPITFLDLKPVDDMISVANILMMGHNRHATLGGVNSANAHPFEHGNITLMHNGTLSNKYALEKKYDAPSFGTDSELVCWLINEHGIEHIVEDLEGAFALTWWDASNSTFNFIRNKERPFAMALYSNLLFYASELKMMEWLLDRNNVGLDKALIIEPDAGEYFVFSYDKVKRTVDYVSQELKLAVKKPVQQTSYGYGYGNSYNYKGSAASNSAVNKNNVTPIHSKPTENKFAKYNEDNGFNFVQGQEVFVYIDEKCSDRYTRNAINRTAPAHFDLTMTMVDEPSIKLKAFYVKADNFPKIDEAFAIKAVLKIPSSTATDDEYLVVDNSNLHLILDDDDKEWQNYLKAADGMLQRLEDKSMIGKNNILITEGEFRKACKNGCVNCQRPIDVEAQIEDGQDVEIIGLNSAVCSDCIDIYNKILKIGVQ